ncbi:MAG: hypothetical protein LBP64_03970 [Tannerella sp.]|nr:hypothetical protein [Tannerella sp.]
MIVSGGENKFYDISLQESLKFSYERKFDAAIGYKLRLEPVGKPFFADLDVQLGYGQWKYFHIGENSGETQPNDYLSLPWKNITDSYFRIAVNPTLNRKVYDGWYAGLGVEPTLYLVSKSESKGSFSAFDVPLTARIGYDFKYIDLSFNYKYGLCDVTDTQYFESGKIRRWQLQLFIPF